MLLALRSLFEGTQTPPPYIPPAGTVRKRKRISFHPVRLRKDGIARLESLKLSPVVGKIIATGTAKTLLASVQANFELGILAVSASANARIAGQSIGKMKTGKLHGRGRGDDDEALIVILDNI